MATPARVERPPVDVGRLTARLVGRFGPQVVGRARDRVRRDAAFSTLLPPRPTGPARAEAVGLNSRRGAPPCGWRGLPEGSRAWGRRRYSGGARGSPVPSSVPCWPPCCWGGWSAT
ncbi:hypothetical protein FE156_09015 [Streptomyces albidoflavus]|nr:hypothetical protein FE156_09015 [Streptomyces albidoflavus]